MRVLFCQLPASPDHGDPIGTVAITFLIYDLGMPVPVNVQTVHSRKLAAVRREIAPGTVGSAWRAALEKVW